MTLVRGGHSDSGSLGILPRSGPLSGGPKGKFKGYGRGSCGRKDVTVVHLRRRSSHVDKADSVHRKCFRFLPSGGKTCVCSVYVIHDTHLQVLFFPPNVNHVLLYMALKKNALIVATW